MMLLLLGITSFTVVILLLVGIIINARKALVASGSVTVNINGEKDIETGVGKKLLGVLADNGIFVSSACGGGGSCGQCRVKVLEGGGDILPTEESHISRREEREGMRLSCQVAVKQDMKIELEPEVFAAKSFDCEVISNNNVATFIKEFVLKVPEKVDFRAGGYIQVVIPPYEADFKDFQVEDRFRSDWEKFGVFRYHAGTKEEVQRAYSMANYPEEEGIVKLNVRIATPPPNKNVPPGVGSSYIWSKKPGDKVTITGPFGEFFAQDTENEMVFIGGGAGMAPLRSIVFDQLKRLNSKRKISYWYGGRSKKELFYLKDFEELQKEFDNFSWHIALSDPLPEDNWDSYTGFIHKVVLDNYLKNHEAPEEIEYYLCGPPMMIDAVKVMLDGLGVEPENIYFDDFGG
ncbi:NADH:ubiquinone oxidoreductase, subunit F [Denitrovibrio acetiphilus DSM 12809]|uniref:Na(+)-translocating NADH-quinone reductase subunit F n=1 Tax=Denitrovibrio acetiphilus (strain DSM 12809 / NBRC 114555 / N2460) TaxID=522772 RepID=D4H1M0_DENA2|nr:NADH:ubiquinone reductase (Na(+)-transporting) subunit F [Denitrovibrio acetiphilus]ADD68780.1 NADH:ubiquinone oxidoreductase, subunit F [Denitrovibrio acetiphilus DSM 12809]